MIDLHIHTTNSDGQYTTAEVLKMCEKAGLTLISITDHSTMNGYNELSKPEVRRLFSGPILPACEFSAHFKGQKIEVLGYGILPEDASSFLARYLPKEEESAAEMEELLRQYAKRDFPFDEEEVRKQLIGWIGFSDPIWKEVSRHPENCARMCNPRSKEAQAIFFRAEMGDRKSPFFFDVTPLFPSAKEVCDFIHSIGGTAIIAHPAAYCTSILDELEELIQAARPDGLEAWYATFSEEQREYLLSLCKKHNLLFSGGSDFHNDMRLERGNVLGIPHLAQRFPAEEILKWVNNCKTI